MEDGGWNVEMAVALIYEHFEIVKGLRASVFSGKRKPERYMCDSACLEYSAMV
jgi:hypothetical protein